MPQLFFAGVGSRLITSQERDNMYMVGHTMRTRGWWLFSGNAPGSDQAFQNGALGASPPAPAVIFLPWATYEQKTWDSSVLAMDHYACGNDVEGQAAVDRLHPKCQPGYLALPHARPLAAGDRRLLARNYRTVKGWDKYPAARFVICCSDPLPGGHVKGGTGQAVRVALEAGIPVVNMRLPGWWEALGQLVTYFEAQP